MSQYTGSCHCGTVRYTAELDLSSPVLECNCSHCQRKGFLLSFIPNSDFELLSGEDKFTQYLFNTHKIHHRFCSICGVQCFGEGEQDGQKTYAINVRTLEDVDLGSLTRMSYDGKSL